MWRRRLWMVPLQMGLFYTAETALIAEVIFFFSVFVCYMTSQFWRSDKHGRTPREFTNPWLDTYGGRKQN